jgi:flagellar hook-length control protein FliK
MAGAGQSPAAAGVADSAQAAVTSNPVVQVPLAEQIATAIRSSGVNLDRQIVINLDPPELGRVKVSLRASGDRVRGVLEADSPETQRRPERETPALTERLQEAGVQIRRLDVVLARQDGHSGAENPLAGGGREQTSDGQAPRGESYATGRRPVATVETVAAAPQASALSASGINVKI